MILLKDLSCRICGVKGAWARFGAEGTEGPYCYDHYEETRPKPPSAGSKCRHYSKHYDTGEESWVYDSIDEYEKTLLKDSPNCPYCEPSPRNKDSEAVRSVEEIAEEIVEQFTAEATRYGKHPRHKKVYHEEEFEMLTKNIADAIRHERQRK